MAETPSPLGNGWSAYERLVLTQIAELKEEVAELKREDLVAIDEKIVLLRIDVAQLKIRAGMWGALAGAVPGLVMALVAFTAGG